MFELRRRGLSTAAYIYTEAERKREKSEKSVSFRFVSFRSNPNNFSGHAGSSSLFSLFVYRSSRLRIFVRIAIARGFFLLVFHPLVGHHASPPLLSSVVLLMLSPISPVLFRCSSLLPPTPLSPRFYATFSFLWHRLDLRVKQYFTENGREVQPGVYDTAVKSFRDARWPIKRRHPFSKYEPNTGSYLLGFLSESTYIRGVL